jgi:hypothetical protein
LSTFDDEDVVNDGNGGAGNAQDLAWRAIKTMFGVDHTSVRALRHRFEDNMEQILVEAFARQCTPGHSCKEFTKKAMGYLLQKAQHDGNEWKA